MPEFKIDKTKKPIRMDESFKILETLFISNLKEQKVEPPFNILFLVKIVSPDYMNLKWPESELALSLEERKRICKNIPSNLDSLNEYDQEITVFSRFVCAYVGWYYLQGYDFYFEPLENTKKFSRVFLKKREGQ